MSYWKKQYEDAIEKKRSQYSPANFHHHQKSPIVSPRKPNNESRIDSDSFSFSSREDMHEILSPSNDDDDVSDQSELEHGVSESYSADSIIRRVEEEIAAAKKAAASARSRLDAFTEEDDMDEILGVDTPPEDQDFHDESSFNESYDHAMDVIGEEFEDDFHDGTLATVMEAEEGQEEASVVAKESPQKFTFNEESGFRAREILGTLKERREHFSQTFTNSTKSDTGSLTEDSNSIIHRDDEKKEDENLPLPARDRMEPLLQPSQTAVTPKVRNQEVASTTTTIPKLVVQPEEVEPVQEERAVVSTPSNELANTAMKVMKTDIETCESIVSKDTRKLETETPRKSRRIRFRDPFPTLKPLDKPRSASEIIEENALGTPECQIQWLRPQNEIRHLILAVMGPSLQRRSNACGALKVLTRQRKNQLTMMRTDSFLESLVFAVSQDIQESEKDFAIDTRTRAVACLRNVCEPKENRAYIITHPGLKECLMKVMQEDRGEARVLACGAFALLAKTPECREPMAFAEGLVDLLSDVMSGVIDEKFGVANLSNTFMSDMSASVTIHSEDEDDRSHSSKESFDSRGSDSSDSSEYTSSSSGSDDSSADPASKVGLIQLSSIRKQNEEMQGEFLQRARSNACAALLHLSKHCAVSVSLIDVEACVPLRLVLGSALTFALALSDSTTCAHAAHSWTMFWPLPRNSIARSTQNASRLSVTLLDSLQTLPS